jgi:asparagine synthetase B (glutamine-hydrolysing)
LIIKALLLLWDILAYSTSGDPDANQPVSSADFLLVHNGNITNARKLAKKYKTTPLSKNFSK